MTHEQLVNVSRMPEFALAKDMVLTALSCRLDCYDTFKKEELGFSITPRTQYCPDAQHDASVVSDIQKLKELPQEVSVTMARPG
jgi:hypothetical protein